jgi:tRNA pseudouridine38-40 synthase
MVIEYDGSHFHGWQKQSHVNSVQAALETAIHQALHSTEISPLQASGRTDAGVHARGQVVNFRTDIEIAPFAFTHAVSSILKHRVAVLSIEKVATDFHALHSATSRQYQYYILNRAAPAVLDVGRVWHVPKPLDLATLNADAAALLGKHDFSSFRGSGCLSKNPVKNIFESFWIREEGDLLVYTIRGKGFLKQMVRNIVGTLVRLNHNKLKAKSIEEVLLARDRRVAGITAPANGLFLDYVCYEGWSSNEIRKNR